MYGGVWDCVKSVMSEEGFGVFYVFYSMIVFMNVLFIVVYFVMYEVVKSGLSEILFEFVGCGEEEEGLLVYVIVGVVGGGLVVVLIMLFDVVKM